MKQILKLTLSLVVFLFMGCTDRNTPFGNFEYHLKNNINENLKIYFYSTINNDIEYEINLLSNSDTIIESSWITYRGIGKADYMKGVDSAVVNFNNIKYIYYLNNFQQTVNSKNIFNVDTYEMEMLNSNEKNEENIKYTFEFTQQDYLLADSL